MLKLDAVFTCGMVLQRDSEVNISGICDGMTRVMISIDDTEVASSTSDETGRFKVVMPPHEVDFKSHTLKVQAGSDTVSLSNVIYGEVWLANGQSNMELELKDCIQGKEAFAMIKEDATLADNIRFYNVVKAPYRSEEWEQKINDNTWITMSSTDATHASAVAFFAALRIYREFNVPVGVVNAVKGGTSVTVWMDEATLRESEEGRFYLDSYAEMVGDKTDEEYFEEMKEYNQRLDEYLIKQEEVYKKAEEEGREVSGAELNSLIGPYPWPEPCGNCSPYRPTALNEMMFNEIINYTYKGVWYYQGEEDALRNEYYKPLLTRYIKYVRERNGSEDLPFILLQLPAWADRNWEEGHDEGWSAIRRIQEEVACEVPNAHVVPLIDLGEFDNIHPVDKKTPGERLGTYTLAEVYKVEGIEARPMRIAAAVTKGSEVYLTFADTYGGLLANVAEHGKEPAFDSVALTTITGFKLSGGDGIYYEADAHVIGDNICLSSDKVPNPTRISYGQGDYVECNLYNNVRMPLMPYIGDTVNA